MTFAVHMERLAEKDLNDMIDLGLQKSQDQIRKEIEAMQLMHHAEQVNKSIN